MIQQATSAFSIDDWKQETYDERGGIVLARAFVKKTFHGDLEATSTAELLLATTAIEGSAAYVGMERVEGTLNGRSGSFVLHHSATSASGRQSGNWLIVPDSGTGELAGISGEARIVIAPDGGHTLILAYDLGQ